MCGLHHLWGHRFRGIEHRALLEVRIIRHRGRHAEVSFLRRSDHCIIPNKGVVVLFSQHSFLYLVLRSCQRLLVLKHNFEIMKNSHVKPKDKDNPIVPIPSSRFV